MLLLTLLPSVATGETIYDPIRAEGIASDYIIVEACLTMATSSHPPSKISYLDTGL